MTAAINNESTTTDPAAEAIWRRVWMALKIVFY